MKTIPAVSKARRIAASLASVTGISPSTTSALRTVATLTTLLLLLPFAALNIPEAEAQLVTGELHLIPLHGHQ